MDDSFQFLPAEFLESLDRPVAVLSESFTVQFINDPFCSNFDMKREDVKGSKINVLFHSNDLSRLMPKFKLVLNGKKFTVDVHVQQMPFQLHLFPLYGQNNSVNGIILNFRKKTYQKKSNPVQSHKNGNNSIGSSGTGEISDLQEIRKMFNTIAEYSNDLVYMTDMDQNFTYLSPSVEQFLGYSLPETCNLHVKDVMTEESYNYQLDLFKRHLEYYADDLSRVHAIDQMEMVRKDGTRFWCETNASLILDEHNNPAGIFGIARDITAQKEKERSLKESSEYYKILAEYATDMIFRIGIEKGQNIKYVSPSVKNILGYTTDEVCSLTAADVLTKESFNYQKDIINERLKKSPGYSKETKKIELQLVNKAGRKIWGESHARLIANERGVPVEIIGILRDVTERKRAEQKDREYQDNLLWLSQSATQFLTLETEDDIYRYIGETLSYWIKDAIFLVNKINEVNNTVTLKNIHGISNNAFNKIIGILGMNPVGKTYRFQDELKELYTQNRIIKYEGGLKDFSFGNFPGLLLKQIEKLLNIKQIYTIGLKRQNHWYAIVHIFKTRTPELKELNLLETFLNQASIALQRKIMEKQWLIAKEEAEKSDKLKTAFLSNMSHEIRSPLNIIMGYSQMLEQSAISPEEKKMYIDSIKKSSSRLLTVIDDIIMISKIETGEIKPIKETFNIKDLMNTVYLEFEKEALEKGLSIEFSNEKNIKDLLVYSDYSKIRKIMSKLLDNAIKFTSSGKITLGCELRDNLLKISVSDTGNGIPSEQEDKIFNNFYQIDHTNTRKYEGTGLGLSISKSLVELLDGDIWIKSFEGKGTTVYFTLPAESYL